jgi:carbonic anhydrase/acetyltransferase-like protein (isoleucine patch superfamily)
MRSGEATVLSFFGKAPKIHDSAFIAPGARIVGDVEIGPDASIWYNCVLRGDINRIVIGARSNLQDGTVVHVEGPGADDEGLPTIVGEDALIGHMAILHGCTLGDRAFVGMGAVVMDRCHVGSGGLLAAGAMLTPGKSLPPGQLWAGRPARFVRELSEAERDAMLEQSLGYVENARRHKAALEAHQGSLP